jgi:hypothetical protein
MNKIVTIIGVVLVVGGAITATFAGIPIADLLGVAVSMVGAGVTCVGFIKKSAGKNKGLTYAAVAMIAVGAFLMPFVGIAETTVTQIITVVGGLVSLITGLFVAYQAQKN